MKKAKNKYPGVITLSGLPGSGKSTTAKALARKLGYDYFTVGRLLRKLAQKQGKSLLEMSKEAEKDHSIDEFLDCQMARYVKKNKNVIVDGRIVAWILDRAGIDSYHVWLEAPRTVRSKRVAIRDRLSEKKAYRDTTKRELSEKKRYKMVYGIDIEDLSIYDLVVNTKDSPPKDVLNQIMEGIKS